MAKIENRINPCISCPLDCSFRHKVIYDAEGKPIAPPNSFECPFDSFDIDLSFVPKRKFKLGGLVGKLLERSSHAKDNEVDWFVIPSFNSILKDSFKTNWDRIALSDYHSEDFTYADIATHIERIHRTFDRLGICPGNKVSICGRNSSRWGIAFLACITKGVVAVPILQEFHPNQIVDIIEHSESKMLFISEQIWKTLDQGKLCSVPVMNLDNYKSLNGNCNLEELSIALSPGEIDYYEDLPDELAVLNYTSGTTSKSKGVMIPYRALLSNYDFAISAMKGHIAPGYKMLSILPMAHMFGLAFEFLCEMCVGCHVTFLNKQASPSVLMKALQEVRPFIVIAVPLIFEKIVRRNVMPKLQEPKMRCLWRVPLVNFFIKRKVRQTLQNAFGGRYYEVIMGGAALSNDVENVLKDINFNYTVGYGATECAPIICYRDWKSFAFGSSGQPAKNMRVKIDSSDPRTIPGEIHVSGPNVMLGYFKNPEATSETLDSDNWYHTGDIGIMDSDNNLFIRGRCKNMLLGANGQNVYPEEMEDVLNSLPLITESIVIQKDQKFYALVYSDPQLVKESKVEDIEEFMELNRKEANMLLPKYSQLSGIKVYDKEFEKTPKKSIKRFLYTDAEI